MGQPFCAFDFKRRDEIEEVEKKERRKGNERGGKSERRSSIGDAESLADDFRRWNIHNLICPSSVFSLLFGRNGRSRDEIFILEMTMMLAREKMRRASSSGFSRVSSNPSQPFNPPRPANLTARRFPTSNGTFLKCNSPLLRDLSFPVLHFNFTTPLAFKEITSSLIFARLHLRDIFPCDLHFTQFPIFRCISRKYIFLYFRTR